MSGSLGKGDYGKGNALPAKCQFDCAVRWISEQRYVAAGKP